MLGGARESDWLAIYCRLLNLVVKIDQDLLPFMQQQSQLYEKHLSEEQSQASLHRVYGPDSNAPNRQPLPEPVKKR
jgi:hypothetical protein